ncbi:exonuclease subunit SbcD [compost metagenome]
MLLVELDGSTLRAVEPLSVPRAVDMLRIGPKPMAEVLEQLAVLPASELARERQPWLEVRVQLEQPQPDLRQQIETALDGKGCRLVRIASEYRGSQEEAPPLVGLDQLSPQELFRRSWQAEYGNEADGQVLQDFLQLLQEVELEGEQSA